MKILFLSLLFLDGVAGTFNWKFENGIYLTDGWYSSLKGWQFYNPITRQRFVNTSGKLSGNGVGGQAGVQGPTGCTVSFAGGITKTHQCFL